jgi:hypothetical protein
MAERNRMSTRRRLIAAGASLGLALMTTQLVPAAQAAHPVERAATPPTIKAHMTNSALKLSSHSVRAGLITFKASTPKGVHVLQLLRLHAGYTPAEFGPDINAAFGGDTAAIARVDDNVTWLSGAAAAPGKPGLVQEKLKAGHYIAVDQSGPGFDQFDVTGTVQKRTPVRTHGSIITYTYGFDTRPTKLPASGWLRTENRADQPHFIELQHVKATTTRHQVAKWIKSGADHKPSFQLPGSNGLGVISPGRVGAWRINMPAGRYLIACFWPDRFSGMPHFLMGMWDLVDLK